MPNDNHTSALHPAAAFNYLKTEMKSKNTPLHIAEITSFLCERIPVQSSAISLLCNYFLTMSVCPDGLRQEEIALLIDYWGEKSNLPIKRIRKSDSIGMQYPVLFAINKFHSLFLKKTVPNIENGCSLFISSCILDSENEDEFSNSIYYRHTYFLRDVVLDACSCIAMPLSPIEFKIKILEIINQKNDLSDKYLESLELLTGERIFATRIRCKPNKKHLYANTHTTSDDDPTPIGEAFSTNDFFDPMDEHPTTTTIFRSPSKNGSKLTKTDDRKVHRYRTQAIAARNIVSITDLHRLPFPLVSKFLQYLFKKDLAAFSFAWILVSTGIDPDKLSDLIVCMEVKDDNKHRLLLDRWRCYLAIPLINGTTNFPDIKGQPTKQQMLIHIQFHLILHLLDKKIPNPYQDMVDTFNLLAQKFSACHAGVTPTAQRMANSFYVVFAYRSFGNLESSMLGGTIPSKNRAQACYYQHDIYDLNAKYKQATKALTDQLLSMPSIQKPLKDYLLQLSFMGPPPQGSIGSQLYQAPEQYFPVMKAIRSEFSMLTKQKSLLMGSSKLVNLIQLFQIQHLYLYMLLQITMALRPVGDRTEFTPSGVTHTALTATKSSHHYAERSQATLIIQVEIQIDQTRIDFQALMSNPLLSGIRVICSEDFLSSNLPLCFSYNQQFNRLNVTRLTGNKSRELLNQFIKDHNLPLQLPAKANNTFRHINATELYSKVPEILCDQFMSHHRDGMGMYDPWSTSSSTCLPAVQEEIDRLTAHIPKAPLQIWSQS